MLRFLGFVVLLISITMCVTVVARITGRGLNPALALFTNPDGSACQPVCLFGIRPGETRVEDAVSLLTSHPLTRDFEVMTRAPFIGRSRQKPDLLITLSGTPEGLVDSVLLSFGLPPSDKEASPSELLANGTSLGDFVSLYGVPDYVCVSEKGGCTAIYVHLGLMIDISPRSDDLEHIMVDESVTRLVLFSMKVCPPTATVSLRSPWRGFTTIKRYQSSSTIDVTLRTDCSLSICVPCLR